MEGARPSRKYRWIDGANHVMSSPWTGRRVAPPAVVGVEWHACRCMAPWRERREDYLAINRQLDDYYVLW